MSRRPRVAPGGFVYHVLNRAVARKVIFEQSSDYAAFERVMSEARDRCPMRILAYCVMPSHWHMVLWPSRDGELSAFMRWLTATHSKRWHVDHGTTGTGHVYQDRFKSFVVSTDEYFLTVCRYVERNPVRAGLVARAEDWRWGSLWRRLRGGGEAKGLLSEWPVERRADWVSWVNTPLTEKETRALRTCLARGTPFGSPDWQSRVADRLGLAHTLRPFGRPRKNGDGGRF